MSDTEVASADQKPSSAIPTVRSAERRQLDLREAAAALREAFSRAKRLHSPDFVSAALEQLWRAYRAERVRPIRQAAAAAHNPLHRALISIVGDIIEEQFHRRPDVKTARKIIAGDIHAQVKPRKQQDRAELCRLLDYLLKVNKQGIFTAHVGEPRLTNSAKQSSKTSPK